MSDFRNFLRRTAGNWTSHRRYFYPSNGKIDNSKSALEVEITADSDDVTQVRLGWKTHDSHTNQLISEGEMLTETDGSVMRRNIGYMTKDETECNVSMIDNDCVVLMTAYSGMNFREEIRLLENDSVRLRQTVGKKDSTGEVFLVGQYYEVRA